MLEKKYVDLLIVKCGDDLFVAEVDSGRAHTGDLVEIETSAGVRQVGVVIDNAMFDEVGGERYKWIAKLHTIYPVVRRWRLSE